MLRTPPRSPEPVLLRACVMVSTFSSPGTPMGGREGDMDRDVDTGLARGFRLGDVSIPLTDPDLLCGGEAPPPELDTGERMGEGDRLTPPTEDRLVRPARWIDSLEPAIPA